MSWIYDRSFSLSKRIETQYGARTGSEYGNVYNYDQTAPDETGTFRNDLTPVAEVATLLAAARTPWSESGSVVSLPVQGVTWQGKIRSLKVDDIMGTTAYQNVEVVLDRPATS